MFRLPKTSQFNIDNQDDDDSSQTDSSDDSSQSWFDPSNPFGADTLDWSPRVFYVDANSQSHLGWGVGFPPSPAFASGSSSASSVSAPSWSSPGGSTAAANASSVSSAASAASGSSGDSTVVVSTSGSGLVFDNTYDGTCTTPYEDCIVAAEDQLESLFTNSDTIVVTFSEKSSPGSGFALTNHSNGIL